MTVQGSKCIWDHRNSTFRAIVINGTTRLQALLCHDKTSMEECFPPEPQSLRIHVLPYSMYRWSYSIRILRRGGLKNLLYLQLCWRRCRSSLQPSSCMPVYASSATLTESSWSAIWAHWRSRTVRCHSHNCGMAFWASTPASRRAQSSLTPRILRFYRHSSGQMWSASICGWAWGEFCDFEWKVVPCILMMNPSSTINTVCSTKNRMQDVSRKWLIGFMAYGWGMAALLTGLVLYLANNDAVPEHLQPKIGQSTCFIDSKSNGFLTRSGSVLADNWLNYAILIHSTIR